MIGIDYQYYTTVERQCSSKAGKRACKSGKAQGSSGRAQDSKGRAQHPQTYA